MNIWIILIIAFGLALDAFAVAIAVSVKLGKAHGRQLFRLSFHFGLFQAVMPVIGWFAGTSIEQYIKSWDHWLAFGLLSAIGVKAIWEAMHGDEEDDNSSSDPTKGFKLIMLSIATSIDALAVGISFAVLRVDILYPAVIIGVVAGALTLLGMRLGGKLGERFGRRMEIASGFVLIGIGIKILIDHLL